MSSRQFSPSQKQLSTVNVTTSAATDSSRTPNTTPATTNPFLPSNADNVPWRPYVIDMHAAALTPYSASVGPPGLHDRHPFFPAGSGNGGTAPLSPLSSFYYTHPTFQSLAAAGLILPPGSDAFFKAAAAANPGPSTGGPTAAGQRLPPPLPPPGGQYFPPPPPSSVASFLPRGADQLFRSLPDFATGGPPASHLFFPNHPNPAAAAAAAAATAAALLAGGGGGGGITRKMSPLGGNLNSPSKSAAAGLRYPRPPISMEVALQSAMPPHYTQSPLLPPEMMMRRPSCEMDANCKAAAPTTAAAIKAASVTAISHFEHNNNGLGSDEFSSYYTKGTLIKLANGALRRVEDLRTDDFVQSVERQPQFRMVSSTVVRIEENHTERTARVELQAGKMKKQVVLDVKVTQPFFVLHQGWASCDPRRVFDRYFLPCKRLEVGDVCISLARRSTNITSQSASLATGSRHRRSRGSSKEKEVPPQPSQQSPGETVVSAGETSILSLTSMPSEGLSHLTMDETSPIATACATMATSSPSNSCGEKRKSPKSWSSNSGDQRNGGNAKEVRVAMETSAFPAFVSNHVEHE